MIVKICVVAAVVVAAVMLQVGYDLWRSHERQIRDAERNAVNLVRLLDEQTARTFQVVDLSLRVAADTIARPPQDTPDRDRTVCDLLNRFMPQLPFVRSLFTVDRDVIMRYLSNQFPASPLDNTTRNYFKRISARRPTMASTSAPVLSRISPQWFISAPLRLDDAPGDFAGVILAAVGSEYFHTVFTSVDVGQEGLLGLYLANGTLMIRSPRDDALTGVSFVDTPLFHHVGAAPSGVFHTAARGAKWRAYSLTAAS